MAARKDLPAQPGHLSALGPLLFKRNDDAATRTADIIAKREGTGMFSARRVSKAKKEANKQLAPPLSWVSQAPAKPKKGTKLPARQTTR